ncbi:MAG: hypothetical protein K2Q22_00655 [Cytophagales bacterium]|nr:hypothetical protein [Cytophagales bacterium]
MVIDAVGFIHPAIHLNELVNPGELRQSRPLYMVVGNGLGHLTAWAINNLYPSFIPSARANCRKELFVSLTRQGDPFDTIAVLIIIQA